MRCLSETTPFASQVAVQVSEEGKPRHRGAVPGLIAGSLAVERGQRPVDGGAQQRVRAHQAGVEHADGGGVRLCGLDPAREVRDPLILIERSRLKISDVTRARCSSLGTALVDRSVPSSDADARTSATTLSGKVSNPGTMARPVRRRPHAAPRRGVGSCTGRKDSNVALLAFSGRQASARDAPATPPTSGPRRRPGTAQVPATGRAARRGAVRRCWPRAPGSLGCPRDVGLGGELLDLREERLRPRRTAARPRHARATGPCPASTLSSFAPERVETLHGQLVARLVRPALDGQREAIGRDIGTYLGHIGSRRIPCGLKLARQPRRVAPAGHRSP